MVSSSALANHNQQESEIMMRNVIKKRWLDSAILGGLLGVIAVVAVTWVVGSQVRPLSTLHAQVVYLPDTVYQATSDGLVAVTLAGVEDGVNGEQAFVRLLTDASNPPYTLYSATSVNAEPASLDRYASSATMVVRSGEYWRVPLKVLSGPAPGVTIQWAAIP